MVLLSLSIHHDTGQGTLFPKITMVPDSWAPDGLRRLVGEILPTPSPETWDRAVLVPGGLEMPGGSWTKFIPPCLVLDF